MVKGLTSIIIPICNTDYPVAHYTGNTIGSVHYFSDLPYEIIVVDNNSTVELGGLKWDEVVDKYIKNTENLGVAKAWNQGIKDATGEYIAILNNDIQVFDFWLSDMVDALKYVDVVQATPMYAYPFGRGTKARDLREEWLYKKPDEYLSDFRDFSCILTTRKLIDKIGLFDEGYGIGYGEDIDFYFRCEQAGFVVKSNKRVNIHHVGMATGHTLGGQGLELGKIMDKNREYTNKKWKLNEYGDPKFRVERRNGAKV